MEILGSFIHEDWESLSQIFSSGENHDHFLMQHCHGSFSSNQETLTPTIFPSHDQANFCSTSQESINVDEIEEALFLNLHGNEEHYHLHNFNDVHTMDFNNAGIMPPHGVLDEDFLRSEGGNQPLEAADSCPVKRSQDNAPQNPKKKPRHSRNAQKNKIVQSKKGKKRIQNNDNNEDEERMNGCSSEEDSNASQELNEEIKNMKARAIRGSATDPQSLYARRRRERINERLRILQNLVPNGTKVDISTMLEEAVQYVKFLQLQIKLLSSDSLWMYAPLAYNGMDIGMYQKICPNLRG